MNTRSHGFTDKLGCWFITKIGDRDNLQNQNIVSIQKFTNILNSDDHTCRSDQNRIGPSG